MKSDDMGKLVLAIQEAFISPNVMDSNYEAANLVDVLAKVAGGLHEIAAAINEHASATGLKD